MKIRIVEDDHVLRDGLTELLTASGYDVESVASLREAEAMLDGKEAPQLWLVDLMLPDGTGLALCRQIHAASETPIIILTALDDEDSVIAGLSSGADDYITKPFRARELLARIEANLRRFAPRQSGYQSGELLYTLPDERIFVHGEEVQLRNAERTLLKVFLESGGRLLKRDYLLYSLWDCRENYVDENTLSVLVSRLRRALCSRLSEDPIETVRGVGYRWNLPVSGGKRR